MNPATQNVSLIEVTPAIAAKHFPAELPPLMFFAALVGGQPSKVYATKFVLRDPEGASIAESVGPDVPFTTQIKRVNLPIALKPLSDASDIIKGPGKYRMEVVIQDEPIGSAEFEIIPAPQQPGI